jgi:hypothetical protein
MSIPHESARSPEIAHLPRPEAQMGALTHPLGTPPPAMPRQARHVMSCQQASTRAYHTRQLAQRYACQRLASGLPTTCYHQQPMATRQINLRLDDCHATGCWSRSSSSTSRSIRRMAIVQHERAEQHLKPDGDRSAREGQAPAHREG